MRLEWTEGEILVKIVIPNNFHKQKPYQYLKYNFNYYYVQKNNLFFGTPLIFHWNSPVCVCSSEFSDKKDFSSYFNKFIIKSNM